MAKANAKLSKTRLFNPEKLPDEFCLKVTGTCMSPMVEDGEWIVVDRRKKIKKGDLVVLFFKPEFVAPGDTQAKLKRLSYGLPAWAKFPFKYEPVPGKYGDFGPIIWVEQINPDRAYVVDLRKVMGIYRAERAPANVQPVPVAAGAYRKSEMTRKKVKQRAPWYGQL